MSIEQQDKRRPRGALLLVCVSTIREVFRALETSRLRAMLPLVILLLIFSLFLLLFAAVPALTPFIYPLF